MGRTLGLVVAILAVALFFGSPVWADSTLHIGTGIGTACQAGCAGDPNLIDGGTNFDIAQVAGGANKSIADLMLVLAVPNDTTAQTLMVTVNGTTTVTGVFSGFDSTTDIYTFLGDTSLNNSNSLTNLEGADCTHDSLCSVTGYGVYVFNLNVPIAPGGFVGLSASGGLQLGTFALGLGTQSDKKSTLDGTPFTEAGLSTGSNGPVSTPEPGSLALLGVGLFSMAGLLRRRLVKS